MIKVNYKEFIEMLKKIGRQDIIRKCVMNYDEKSAIKEWYLECIDDTTLNNLIINNLEEVINYFKLNLRFIKAVIKLKPTEFYILEDILKKYIDIMDVETIQYYCNNPLLKTFVYNHLDNLNDDVLAYFYNNNLIKDISSDVYIKAYTAKVKNDSVLNMKESADILILNRIKKFSLEEILYVLNLAINEYEGIEQQGVISELIINQCIPDKYLEYCLDLCTEETLKYQKLDSIINVILKRDLTESEIYFILNNMNTGRQIKKDLYLKNIKLGINSKSLPVTEFLLYNM